MKAYQRQGMADFFCKGPNANIFVMLGHMVLVATIQLGCWNMKAEIVHM